MSSIVVIAPHPDDETLGCGGTLLRHKANGNSIHWIIVTSILESNSYTTKFIQNREKEIEKVSGTYQFDSVHKLGFPTSKLDTVSVSELVEALSKVFKEIEPTEVYLPFPGDIHTDHKIVFDVSLSCTKWFRYPTVKRVLVYETLSETDFALNQAYPAFNPNIFVNIEQYLERKLEIMAMYGEELGEFPFPRCIEAIRAQATLRGVASGCKAAESFMLLKEIR